MAEDNIELTSNLENLLSPFCYEPELVLPKTLPEVPGGMYLSGFISQDCTWGCCYNHSVIKCFPVDRYFEDSHTSFAVHSSNASVAVSSSSYTFSGGHITCATELAIHNLKTSSGMRKLLLGISYTSDHNNRDVRGAVVIFDPIRCAPMKWIEIPDPVSSITVLSHFEEGGSNRPFFNETMMAMVGIAAVGLRGGSVIIIDLGLDDPNLSNVPDSRNASELTYRLLYVNPHEYVIATKRHKAVSKRSLISLRFTNEPDEEMIAEAFHYCKPTGESILVLHKNSVAVTCLEYIPAIGSLLVGFTCGGFQIWRVNNMELQFSSDPVFLPRSEPAHVFGFSFQQPVDDPKNYCYIWVMYGNKSAECTNTHVELHSLYYEQKNHIENFGFVYDGFKQCAKRMSFPLLDDFLPTDSENEDFETIRCSARPIRIWTQPESDLMYCTWEVGRGGIIYLGAFDLNQWYSNHTKEHIFYNPDSGLCPYWVALPVEIPEISNFVMDVRIMPKSLMRWENPHTKLDVHLYPASVSFRAICLTNTGVSAFEHFGVQEKLVRIVLKDGPSLMMQPENIKNSFVRYGLEPVFPHVYGEHLSLKDRDRFFILTVLLENRRTPAIIRLAGVWLDGSYANVGCTIDLIIDWIGGYMVALRGGADEHWSNLFDFADDTLPPETVRFINFSNFAWTSLHRLLLTLMGPTEVYTVRRQELENMEFGLGKLVQYSAALLMMFKARLLPECDRSFVKILSDYYVQRRFEAKTALDTCAYIDNQLKRSHPLMIDHLMDNLMAEDDLREEWHVEEGQHCYPPQHVGYLVNMFMWPDTDPKAISRVFMYFLIDLSFSSQNADASQHSVVERKVLGDFKAVMNSTAEEYQEIYVLWLLDHGIPNEILVHLKENDRLYQNDGLPWCAAAVALTALGYENDVAELLLKSCPRSLAKLLFSLMTSSISKYTSLAELMISSNLNEDEELLHQFFEKSHERLAEFIRTKSKELPQRVEAALLVFLNNSNSVKRLSQLLMFYVHTEDYKRLEEEFARVRETVGNRTLSNSERKMWKFQETYINHLLTTTKTSMVQQFLRRQSHQNIRPAQSTITIKAIAAIDDVNEVPDHIKSAPKLKLLPHLRRVKLSETIAHDPLSPLRRYAGRIQTAVDATASDEEKGQVRSRRFSSRKSLSRRISLPMARPSLVNSANISMCNENETLTNESRLNTTAKNSHIDLISLLKTPSVDHRADNSKRISMITLNQTALQAVDEESGSQISETIHSIMKETDPSKPKTAKKVELRFENLSLSSEEGEEKNATIYEDADENLEDNSLVNQGFDVSSNSAIDKSLFGSESVGDFNQDQVSVEECIPVSVEKETPDLIENKIVRKSKRRSASRSTTPSGEQNVEHDHVSAELHTPTDIRRETRASKSPSRKVSTDEVSNSEEHGATASAKKVEVRLESLSSEEGEEKNATIYKDADENLDDNNLVNQGIENSSNSAIDKSLFGSESVGDFNQDQAFVEESIPVSVEESILVSVEESILVSVEKRTTDLVENKTVKKSKRRSVSRCTTPTRESNVEHDHVSAEPHTPPDMEQASEEREVKPTRKNKRGSSRSVTPTRDVELESAEISKPIQRNERTSVSINRELHEEEVEQNEEAINLRRSSRVSRSRTPTREAPPSEHESVPDETERKVSSRRTLRATRSTTPTREAIGVDADADLNESDTISTRRTTRSLRSKTPTRDAEVKAEDPPPNEDLRSRKVSTDEVSNSKEHGATASAKKVEVRSENLFSEKGEENNATIYKDADENLEDNSLVNQGFENSSNSTIDKSLFGSESIGDFNQHQVFVEESILVSAEKRTTDLVENKTVKKSKRRSASRCTTPTRESNVEHDLVSAERHTPIDIEQAPVEPEVKPTRKNKRGSSRSVTPTRDVELESAEISKPIRRSARTSVSINRELYEEEVKQNEEAINLRRSSRVSRSRTPTREAPPSEHESVPDETEKKVSTRRTLRATRSTTPTREAIGVDADADLNESDTISTRRTTRSLRSKTPTRDAEVKAEDSPPSKALKRETRASKTPSREVSTDEISKSEEHEVTASAKKVRKSLVKSLLSPEAATSSSSFAFEITQEDMEEEEEAEELDDTILPSTSKSTGTEKLGRARKRRLKYLHHQTFGDLSTVLEDPESEPSNASVFEATVIPSTSQPQATKTKKIKGIKVRPAEEESEPVKPTKRRKAAALVADFDEDDDLEVGSQVSSRSTRSASSRRSGGSVKTKTSRRKGRTASKSTS